MEIWRRQADPHASVWDCCEVVMRSATGIIQFPLDLLTKSGAATSLQGAAKGMRSEGLTDDEMWRRNTRRIGCVGGGGLSFRWYSRPWKVSFADPVS